MCHFFMCLRPLYFNHTFAVLLPFGEHILNNLQDPFDFEKILAISADIIAERTAAKDSNDVPVSSYHYDKEQHSV